MQKRALLACLLAACLLLSSCSLIVKDPEVDAATPVLTVNGTVFTKGQVNEAVEDYVAEYAAYYRSYYGGNIDTSNPDLIKSARDLVIGDMKKNEVIAQHMKEFEAGQPELALTETDEAEVQDTWRTYSEFIQNYYLSGSELEGDELQAEIDRQTAEMLGTDLEGLRAQKLESLRTNRFKDFVTQSVAVTDEEVQAEFDTRVANAKTSYESDLSAYGKSVNGGSAIYYRPAGYREVKWILVELGEIDDKLLSGLDSRISAQNSAINTLTGNLTTAGVENVDELVNQVTVTLSTDEILNREDGSVSALTVVSSETAFGEGVEESVAADAKSLAEARALKAAYEAKRAEVETAAYAAVEPKAQELYTALKDGGDWDTLSAEYNGDPNMSPAEGETASTYAVCEGYTGTTPASETVAAVMALTEAGSVTEPVRTKDGFVVAQYVGDVAEGTVDLAGVSEAIRSELLSTKKDTFYDNQVQQWVDAAQVTLADLKVLDD